MEDRLSIGKSIKTNPAQKPNRKDVRTHHRVKSDFQGGRCSLKSRFMKDVANKNSSKASSKDGDEFGNVIKVIEEEKEEGSLQHNLKMLQKNRIKTVKDNRFDTTNKTEIELSHMLMTNKEREMIVSPTELRPSGFDLFNKPTDFTKDIKNKTYENFNKENKTMELLTSVYAHLDSVNRIEFIEKSVLFSFGSDGLIKEWQVQSEGKKTKIKNKSTFRFHGAEIFSSAKDENLIFSGDRAGQITMLKRDKDKWEFERMFKTGREPVWSLDYNRNKSLLLSSSPNKLKVWSPSQLSDTKEMYNLSTNKKFFAKSLFLNNSDDCLVYSFTPDWTKNEFVLRNLETEKELGTIGHSANFCNDFVIENSGRLLISANENKTVELYDLRSYKLIKSFVAIDSPITSILSLNGGTQLLTGGTKSSLRLWDLRNYHCLQELSLHKTKYGESVFDIAKGEKDLVATAGADAEIRFFKLY